MATMDQTDLILERISDLKAAVNTFKSEAADAMSKLERNQENLEKKIDGINNKVDKENRTNALQDKDIELVKENINGQGRRIDGRINEMQKDIEDLKAVIKEQQDAAQKKAITDQDSKTKFKIVWAIVTFFIGSGGAGAVTLFFAFLKTRP